MSLKWLITLKTLAVKENNMSSKFATPFLKKSPLLGAYENAADGKAFMGGLVTGQEQFAKLQQDITKGFDNYMKGEGTQQRLEKKSLDNLNEIADKTSDEYTSAKAAHDKRFDTKPTSGNFAFTKFSKDFGKNAKAGYDSIYGEGSWDKASDKQKNEFIKLSTT